MHMPLRAGRWAFTGRYESARKGGAADGTPLWTGKLESPPTEINVGESTSGR